MTCERCGDLERRLDELFGRYDALVHESLLMRREGFAPPSPEPEVAKVEELPKEVRLAIAEVAEPGGLTFRHLERQAWELLRDSEASEADVATLIRQGEPASL